MQQLNQDIGLHFDIVKLYMMLRVFHFLKIFQVCGIIILIFQYLLDANKYGMSRDELYFKMKAANILGRRYFYPLISTFSTYRGLPSASSANLPVATRMAQEVICLPIHHELSNDDVNHVISIICK